MAERDLYMILPFRNGALIAANGPSPAAGDTIAGNTVYLGILNSGVELSGSGYARVAVTVQGLTSTADVTFPTASGNWTGTHFAFYDASSGGNEYTTLRTASPISVPNGETLRIPAGDLDWTIKTLA